MDVVIPFRHSRNRDEELRYVLRSIERNIPELGDIYIIGPEPSWRPKNLVRIDFKRGRRLPYYKEYNIGIKLLRACDDQRISKKFLYHDDDEILLQPFDGSYYHKGNTWDEIGCYIKTQQNTKALFPGKSINNFNVHCPRIFDKELLKPVLTSLDWNLRYGYSINTVYAVRNNIDGVCIEDVKFKSCLPWDVLMKRYAMNKRFFSIPDSAWKPDMKKLLNNLLPIPSKYES